MSLTLIADQPQVSTGLVTYTYTTPAAGIYTVRYLVTENPPSSLVVKVKDNSSDVFTAPTIGQTQSEMEFKYSQLYASGHAITVVMTSTGDSAINTVKSQCSIGLGL